MLDPETANLAQIDVRVRGDRIVEIGRLCVDPADRVLDVGGLTVTAGFIDSHTHADCVGFLDANLESLAAANLLQGVTTQVCGNCGFSPFPVGETADIMGFLVPALGPGTRTFHSFDAWAGASSVSGLPTNLAPLVGHGTLRAAAMGFPDRPAAEGELVRMETMLDEAFRSGAYGLSSGLIYAPGLYASTDEMVRLARIATRYRAPYVSHIRNETDRLETAVAEAMEIGKRAGTAVHISHHKAAGKRNWGRTADTLRQIDKERATGHDVTVDVYPYTAGSTALQAILPPWALQGGADAMLKRLTQPAFRRRITDDLHGTEGWQNLVLAAGWDGIKIAAAEGHTTHEGKSLMAIAQEEHRDPVDVAADLLIAEHGNVTIILEMMDEGEVRNVLRWPHTMIGSDGILQPGRPHPRLAGTFARILGHYSRDQAVWPLVEAVRRMTVLPARRFRLSDRGRVTPGSAADLVIFDPSRIRDRATYDRPLEPPEGVAYVIVNGAIAVDNGKLTGRAAGRVLMRS